MDQQFIKKCHRKCEIKCNNHLAVLTAEYFMYKQSHGFTIRYGKIFTRNISR